MKNLCFLLTFLFVSFTAAVQGKTPLFGYGISNDFLSIPLAENSLLSGSTNVFVACAVNNHLNFRLGYDGWILKDVTAKKYEQLSGLMLGAGYVLGQDENRNFTTELTASLSNGFKNFTAFKDYHADLGVRFLMFKAFYLGTGLRWSHNETPVFPAASTNNYNLYMQMGMQFYLGKK